MNPVHPAIEREDFLAVLYTARPRPCNAIVALCGEDAEPRYQTAYEAFRLNIAPLILLSGGKHQPPRYVDAAHCYALLMGLGIAHDKIMVEGGSQNTREQAEAVVQIARQYSWQSIALVASAYHLPRAFLTFLAVLFEQALDDKIAIVPIVAGRALWDLAPGGMEPTRLALRDAEIWKIREYGDKGHVAGYRDGTDYLLEMQAAT